MDSPSSQSHLNMKQSEHEALLKQLEEAEKRVKAYEEATQRAYEEVGQMQTELQEEQKCLETAVRVASELYSKNTELKKRSTRRTIGDSQRRKAWKEQFDKEAASSPVYDIPENDEGGSNYEDEVLYDDVEEIVALDNRSKSDLEKAINKGNSLRELNREISTKLSKYEAERREYETTIAQLQAVVKIKDEELEALKEKYDVESQVRQRAETYAAKMYGRNKAFQRKSVMLKRDNGESLEDKLEDTMKDFEKLTQELEEEKMCHKREVQNLEDQLRSAISPEVVKGLENKISLLAIEIDKLKERNTELEQKNLSLETQIQDMVGLDDVGPPPSAPPPPPPPPAVPPPLPPSHKRPDPAEAIYDLIAERKANKPANRSGGRSPAKSATFQPTSCYSDAMEEMMRRIKSGTVLKKASTLPMSSHNGATHDSGVGDNGNNSDDEYDEIYSQIESVPKGPHPVNQMATLGRYTGVSKQRSPIAISPNSSNLKPVNLSNDQQTNGRREEFQERDRFSRPYQDSVKVPKDINPDLKRILEKRRMGMKKAQSEAENK